MLIKPLSLNDFDMLHGCWNEAFGDYIVKIQISKERLKNMLCQNAISYELSVGAFENGEMVGFLLNGVRHYNQFFTAYDTGTAIIKNFRGKGLAKEMFELSENNLKTASVKKYLLEVITTNEKAYKLYKGNGFNIIRTFDCFESAISDIKAINSKTFVTESSFDECKSLSENFLNYVPSWSHTIDAIKSVKNNLHFYKAIIDNKVCGYAIHNSKSGRIFQIGANVNDEIEIYKSLIHHAIKNTLTDNIALINIPDSDAKLLSAFESVGMKKTISQYEMEKTL